MHLCAAVSADVIVCSGNDDCGDALVQNADFGPAFQCIPDLTFFAVTCADLQVHAHHAHVLFGEILAMLTVDVQLVLQALVAAGEALNQVVFIFHVVDVVFWNHHASAHGALVAVLSPVRHVSHNACEMVLVAAIQAYEVTSGVGGIKADGATVLFFGLFSGLVWSCWHELHVGKVVLVVLVRGLSGGVRVRVNQNNFIAFIDFIVLNVHNFVAHNFGFGPSDGRQLPFVGIQQHFQSDNLQAGENQVLAIAGLDLDGALPIQIKQVFNSATDRIVLDGVENDPAANHLNWNFLYSVCLYSEFVFVFVTFVFVTDFKGGKSFNEVFVFRDFFFGDFGDFVDFVGFVDFGDFVDFVGFVDFFAMVFIDWVGDFVIGFDDVREFAHAPHLQMIAGIVQTLTLDFIAVTVFGLLIADAAAAAVKHVV